MTKRKSKRHNLEQIVWKLPDVDIWVDVERFARIK